MFRVHNKRKSERRWNSPNAASQ